MVRQKLFRLITKHENFSANRHLKGVPKKVRFIFKVLFRVSST